MQLIPNGKKDQMEKEKRRDRELEVLQLEVGEDTWQQLQQKER